MQRPGVGVGVIVIKDNKILLGKRKNAHGAGCWAFPGGHLEFNETLNECAIRETFEETGIKIKNLRTSTFTNDIFEKENKHYITCYVLADHDSGIPQAKEPHKCERWDWFSWEELPSPLFLTLQNLKKQNFHPLR